MQADSVAFGIAGDGNVPVFTDGEFFLENHTASGCHASSFRRAVFAGKVDDGATGSCGTAVHPAKGTVAAGGVWRHIAGKHPHFQAISFALDSRSREGLQLNLKDRLVEGFGAGHVVGVDFKPADRIAFWIHRFCGCVVVLFCVVLGRDLMESCKVWKSSVPGLALVNDEGISIGVLNHEHVANGCFHRAHRDLDAS